MRTSGIRLVGPLQSFSSGFCMMHWVLMSRTSSIEYDASSPGATLSFFYSLHRSFSLRKSRITKYKLQRSSLLDRSTLLWALREAKETVPRKSAFFLGGTGFFRSSLRWRLASPKSTMYTYLLSLDSTKFEALTSLCIKPRLCTSSMASNISISSYIDILRL